MDVQAIRVVTDSVRGEVRKAVVGQDEVILESLQHAAPDADGGCFSIEA